MNIQSIKGKPLTKEETRALIDLIEKSKIITTKATNASNNKLKMEEWLQITNKFNASAANCPRNPQQLRLKWENLKKNARKRCTKIRINQFKTGDGPADYTPPDEVLDRVTALLGSTATGFTAEFGGDSEIVQAENGGGDATVSPIVEADSIIGGKKKIKPDDSRTCRNLAVAEYFKKKTIQLDADLENKTLQKEQYMLENEKLKLITEKLKLENEKLKLENEKLKIELEKIKREEF